MEKCFIFWGHLKVIPQNINDQQRITGRLACVTVWADTQDLWHSYLSYSKTCVRQPPLKLTLVVDVERWLSYKGTYHVILLAKLHDMYLYKTDNFFHINHYLKWVSKAALLHRFDCMSILITFVDSLSVAQLVHLHCQSWAFIFILQKY